jgi:hypothetical protein
MLPLLRCVVRCACRLVGRRLLRGLIAFVPLSLLPLFEFALALRILRTIVRMIHSHRIRIDSLCVVQTGRQDCYVAQSLTPTAPATAAAGATATRMAGQQSAKQTCAL